jgi:hypothetical protein
MWGDGCGHVDVFQMLLGVAAPPFSVPDVIALRGFGVDPSR